VPFSKTFLPQKNVGLIDYSPKTANR